MSDLDIISQARALKYLEAAASIKGTALFSDMHTHPFEIVFTNFNYRISPEQNGLYSNGLSKFTAPKVTELNIAKPKPHPTTTCLFKRPAIFRMKLSALYAHTGPAVFDAQMDLSGIDRILLLPVAGRNGSIDAQMNAMGEMFPDRQRYFFGWSVANCIKSEAIFDKAIEAVNRFNIAAIKLNLSQLEINPSSYPGKMRVEQILRVCSQLNLPLIVHSGKSPLSRNSATASFSTLEVLRYVKWNVSSSPVIFAHAGSYCCDYSEINDQTLPLLKKMLSKFDNLFIDISGIDTSAMALVIDSIPTDRILFGSDTLYEPQWQLIVKLYHVLENHSAHPDTSFLKIVSDNTDNYIFNYGYARNAHETKLSE